MSMDQMKFFFHSEKGTRRRERTQKGKSKTGQRSKVSDFHVTNLIPNSNQGHDGV